MSLDVLFGGMTHRKQWTLQQIFDINYNYKLKKETGIFYSRLLLFRTTV